MVEDNFSEALLDGVIKPGRIALIDAKDDEIVISDDGPVKGGADEGLKDGTEAEQDPVPAVREEDETKAVSPA